jgi:outer membrane receptor protein involved in Fe transport
VPVPLHRQQCRGARRRAGAGLRHGPWRGFSLNFSGSYAHAAYTANTYGGITDAATGTRALVIPAGQALPGPNWRFSGNARYRRRLRGTLEAYGGQRRSCLGLWGQLCAGVGLLRPRAADQPRCHHAARADGVSKGPWEASFYVDNLLDLRGALQVTHNNALSINMRYVLQRPRTFGLRLSYRGC